MDKTTISNISTKRQLQKSTAKYDQKHYFPKIEDSCKSMREGGSANAVDSVFITGVDIDGSNAHRSKSINVVRKQPPQILPQKVCAEFEQIIRNNHNTQNQLSQNTISQYNGCNLSTTQSLRSTSNVDQSYIVKIPKQMTKTQFRRNQFKSNYEKISQSFQHSKQDKLQKIQEKIQNQIKEFENIEVFKQVEDTLISKFLLERRLKRNLQESYKQLKGDIIEGQDESYLPSQITNTTKYYGDEIDELIQKFNQKQQ